MKAFRADFVFARGRKTETIVIYRESLEEALKAAKEMAKASIYECRAILHDETGAEVGSTAFFGGRL